jgi:phosphoglycolate phosphatase
MVDELQAAFGREYDHTWRAGTTIYEGIHELMIDLHRSGLPLAVLSNKPHRHTVEIVEALFGRIPFAPILGQRADFPKQPDPAGALHIAADLALPPAEIAFVGDSTVDFETARAAGMQPLLVTWGFHPVAQLTATAAPLLHCAEDLRRSLPGPPPAA